MIPGINTFRLAVRYAGFCRVVRSGLGVYDSQYDLRAGSATDAGDGWGGFWVLFSY